MTKKTDPKDWTFRQASMYFLEDCETRNREPVKLSTLEAYTGHIKHIKEALGGRKVASFSVVDMKEFVQTLVGKNLKPKTIQTIVTTLKAIIAFPRDKHLNQLFKMDFESGTLLGRVILGPAQGDDRIESVLTLRRAALPTVCPRVMDE